MTPKANVNHVALLHVGKTQKMSGKKTSLEGIWRHLMLKENYLELVVPRASDKCSCFCNMLGTIVQYKF